MSQHKRTHLFFSRTEENPFGIHFFHIHLASWATKQQLDVAWKMTTIAQLEGWTLESRDEREIKRDIVADICPSLHFLVDLWGQEKLDSNFFPADVATFDHTLLERG